MDEQVNVLSTKSPRKEVGLCQCPQQLCCSGDSLEQEDSLEFQERQEISFNYLSFPGS